MSAIIQTAGLTRRFGKKLAVSNLSLEVPRGSIFAFLGPNGAGKTTTIKMLMNIIQPSGGKATVLGSDSARLGPDELARIGYVSENQELPEWMTVEDLIDYCQPMYPSWDKDLSQQLLRQFTLPLDQKLKNLSRGMKVKASLLTSLSYRPELIVLDEPFTGLDALVRDEFIRGLLELSDQNEWTILVASHDIDEVERLADWVGVVNQGELQLCEPTSSLQTRFRQCEVTLEPDQELPKALPDSWLLAEKVGQVVRFVESSHQKQIFAEKIRSALPGLKNLAVNPMSLKEIFVTLAKTYRMYD